MILWPTVSKSMVLGMFGSLGALDAMENVGGEEKRKVVLKGWKAKEA